MHQHRHAEFFRQLRDALEVLAVRLHAKLLFPDADGAAAKKLPDFVRRFLDVRNFIGEGDEFVPMLPGQRGHAVVAAALGIQPVKAAGRQQHGGRRAHDLLVADELFVRAPGIVGVLVDVDNRLGVCRGSLGPNSGRPERHFDEDSGRGGQELAAGQTCGSHG